MSTKCCEIDEAMRAEIFARRPDLTPLFLSRAVLYAYRSDVFKWEKRFNCELELGVADDRAYVCAYESDSPDVCFTHELIGKYEKSTKSCFYYFRADVTFGFAFAHDSFAAEFEAKLKAVGLKNSAASSGLRGLLESKGLHLETGDEAVFRAVSDHLKSDILIENGWVFARRSDGCIVIAEPPCAKAGDHHPHLHAACERDMSHLRNLSIGGAFETTDVAIPPEMQARMPSWRDDGDVIDFGLDHGPIIRSGAEKNPDDDAPAVFHIVARRESDQSKSGKGLAAARDVNPAAHNSFGDLPTMRHVVFGPIYHKGKRGSKDEGPGPLAGEDA